MYTFESRVRYSETDETGRLSVTGIMNYFQDCSTFQSEDLHMGISYLEEEKRAWWLNSWQIVIDRYPSLGEKIQISTYPHGFKGIYGYRNFLIRDESGAVIVKADSCWFFYDLEKGCPARVTPKEIRGYGECEEPICMSIMPSMQRLPESFCREILRYRSFGWNIRRRLYWGTKWCRASAERKTVIQFPLQGKMDRRLQICT